MVECGGYHFFLSGSRLNYLGGHLKILGGALSLALHGEPQKRLPPIPGGSCAVGKSLPLSESLCLIHIFQLSLTGLLAGWHTAGIHRLQPGAGNQ